MNIDDYDNWDQDFPEKRKKLCSKSAEHSAEPNHLTCQEKRNLEEKGGNLHQSRHYSQYLSLQIKARMEGLETPVYGLQEVHHLE